MRFRRYADFTLPSLDLTGTPADRLIGALEDALDALNVAWAALKETAPNARDYRWPPELFDRAAQEHRARVAKLESLIREYEALTQAVEEKADEASKYGD